MESMKSFVDEFLESSALQGMVLNTTTMHQYGQTISDFFWSSSFWLPEGITWNDLKNRTDVTYADPTEIWTYPAFFAVILVLFRVIILDAVVSPYLASKLGVKTKRPAVITPNSTLEKIHQRHQIKVPLSLIESTATDLSMTVRQVQFWLRQRQSLDKTTKLERFQQTVFIAFYHIGISTFAVVALYSKPWLSDVNLCFVDYPHHSMDPEVWWLYMLALTFYWAQTGWEIMYPHGKDMLASMVHHFLTILLISFSWTGGFFRVGSLVLLIHEPTDVPLLLGKMCKYANLQKQTDVIFAFFVGTWVLTRVYLFPFWLLKACFLEMPPESMSPAGYFLYCLLFGLFVLNLLWTVMIAKVISRMVLTGRVNDVRSSDEVSDAAEPELSKKQN